MSGKTAKKARHAARIVLPTLEQTYDAKVPKTPPGGFWRKVRRFFSAKLRARDQADWDQRVKTGKTAYLKKGAKRLARIATQAMRAGIR